MPGYGPAGCVRKRVRIVFALVAGDIYSPPGPGGSVCLLAGSWWTGGQLARWAQLSCSARLVLIGWAGCTRSAGLAAWTEGYELGCAGRPVARASETFHGFAS